MSDKLTIDPSKAKVRAAMTFPIAADVVKRFNSKYPTGVDAIFAEANEKALAALAVSWLIQNDMAQEAGVSEEVIHALQEKRCN